MCFVVGTADDALYKAPRPLVSQDVKQMVRNMMSAFPRSQADGFIGDQVAINSVLEMLRDSKEEAYWPSAVLVLGYISPYDSTLARVLADFLESARDFPSCTYNGRYTCRKETSGLARRGISTSLSRAKLNVLLALGDLVRKLPEKAETETADESCVHPGCSAFHYLVAGLKPSHWAARILWNERPEYMTKDDRDEDLASMAIKGLGITCRKDAIEMLRQMSKQENISVHLHEAVAESLTYCSNDSTH
jgi:hypothetical protein